MARTASARQVRAAVLSAASFTLGLAGHQHGGGGSASTEALALAAAYCVLAGLAYSRRRLSGPAVTAILLTNQVVLHVGLTLGATSEGAHSGHGSTGLVPGVWMILSHLTATALTAVAIVVVEGSYLVCIALLNWISRAVRLVPAAPRAPRRVACGTAYRHPHWRSHHPGSVPGRGPPRSVAFA
jgi:hypothetical protein